MALASGIGADVTKPLAIVVVGGIGLVPLFILVVLPVTVDLLGRARAEQEERAELAAAARPAAAVSSHPASPARRLPFPSPASREGPR
ncbi:hypothetical protein ACFQX4_10770 [Roseomonas sp. GCM10028921]